MSKRTRRHLKLVKNISNFHKEKLHDLGVITPKGRAQLIHGDAKEVVKELVKKGVRVDSIIMDPSYGLRKTPPKIQDVLSYWENGLEYPADGVGYMNQRWDAFVWGPIYGDAIKLVPPGGTLSVFSHPRTVHWTMIALELAGWVIKTTGSWNYGTAYPKTVDIGKGIDKHLGATRTLKRFKPRPKSSGTIKNGNMTYPHQLKALERGYHESPSNEAVTSEAKFWNGWKTDLKPSHELIVFAQRPISETTYSKNVLKHRAGAWNIDACRIKGVDTRKITSGAPKGSGFGTKGGVIAGSKDGRYPSNVFHDGSDSVVSLFNQQAPRKKGTVADYFTHCPWSDADYKIPPFLYCKKPSRIEKDFGIEKEGESSLKNRHSTVKPISLMGTIAELTTPTHGTILDLTMGSGSTGMGALLSKSGFRFIGVEIDNVSFNDALKRITATERIAPQVPEEMVVRIAKLSAEITFIEERFSKSISWNPEHLAHYHALKAKLNILKLSINGPEESGKRAA